MAGNKPLPKSQDQLSAEQTGASIDRSKDRAHQVRRDNDAIKNYSVGIKDIDEAIYYYFNEILQPTVTQNGSNAKRRVLPR